MDTPKLSHRLGAEALGTFWLVFGGCGSAILAAKVPSTSPAGTFNMGIAFVGVALAFGLTVLTMAYAVGHISGGHFNPAVTVGLVGRQALPPKEVLPTWWCRSSPPIAAAGVLLVMANGIPGGYHTDNSRGAFAPTVTAAVAGWLQSRLGPRHRGGDDLRLPLRDPRRHRRSAPAVSAPIAIGLALTLIHLITIPVTNTSVNPGPLHRRRVLRRRVGGRPALAVLARSTYRRDHTAGATLRHDHR